MAKGSLYGPGLAFMSSGPGSAALILKVSEQSLARDGYVRMPYCTNPWTDSVMRWLVNTVNDP